MKRYSHLSYQKVYALDNYLLSGKSMRSITVFLGRAVSTISRQLSRHGGALRYRPYAAYEKYQEQKHVKRRLKIEKHAELKAYIIEKLRAGWAPVIISARWNMLGKDVSVNGETIYHLQTRVRERLPFDVLTCTFDNGCEFAHHKKFGMSAYFCHPHSPWEKGSIEQFNGILRQWVPFSEPLKNITQEKLDRIAYAINNIPRKSLGFLSPIEMLEKLFNQKMGRVALQI